MNIENIEKKFKESSELIKETGESKAIIIKSISEAIINCYKNNNKLLIAGNGGSAADAQHIAGELVNTFYKKRKALSAIALTTDSSVITAQSNDYSYDYIFERQVEAHGKPGDIFMAITTSGNSKNLIYAAKKAKEIGLTTIGLLGKNGGEIRNFCEYQIIVPSNDTARIQEAHHVIYHTICEIVENAFLE